MPKEKSKTSAAALQAFMNDYQVSPGRLAKAVSMSQSGVRQIAIGQTGITIPVALRLAKYFGTTPAYWIDLQIAQDLADAAKDPKLSAILKAITKAKKPAKAPAKAARPAAAKTGKPAPKTASKAKKTRAPRTKK
jgi:addiction module HigA family antidote